MALSSLLHYDDDDEEEGKDGQLPQETSPLHKRQRAEDAQPDNIPTKKQHVVADNNTSLSTSHTTVAPLPPPVSLPTASIAYRKSKDKVKAAVPVSSSSSSTLSFLSFHPNLLPSTADLLNLSSSSNTSPKPAAASPNGLFTLLPPPKNTAPQPQRAATHMREDKADVLGSGGSSSTLATTEEVVYHPLPLPIPPQPSISPSPANQTVLSQQVISDTSAATTVIEPPPGIRLHNKKVTAAPPTAHPPARQLPGVTGPSILYPSSSPYAVNVTQSQTQQEQQSQNSSLLRTLPQPETKLLRQFDIHEQSAANVVDIKQDDLMVKTEHERQLAAFEAKNAAPPPSTFNLRTSYWSAAEGKEMRVDGVHGQQKRKHQINSLAIQAKKMEHEILKVKAQGNAHKQLARAKYGW